MAEVRLIDANAIFPNDSITIWSYDGEETARGILKAIDNSPTIDDVPVVRCRDCKFRGFDFCPMCHDEYTYDEDEGNVEQGANDENT